MEVEPAGTASGLLGSRSFGTTDKSDLLEVYSAILESAPDALVLAGTDGRIVFINEQTVRLFGHSREELMGQLVEILVPERFREKHPHHRDVYAKNPHFRAMGAGVDLYGRRRDGSEFPVEISLSPIRFKDRVYVAAAIRDATERRTAQRTKQLSHERLLKIQRLEQERTFKTHFMNLVSHELNTPITPLKMQLHLLERRIERDDVEGARNSLKVLNRNMNRIVRLIGDILDVSRLEAGRLKFDFQRVDLGELLEHTKESFHASGPDHLNHSGRLRIKLPPGGADLKIDADPDRLQQVIDNLVANALRLSAPTESVTIAVESHPEKILIKVQDQGPGLSQQQIEMLFKPFSQVHDRNRDSGGTGLGLYVSQEILKAHEGALHAESEGAGKGATFIVELPRKQPENRRNRLHGDRSEPSA